MRNTVIIGKNIEIDIPKLTDTRLLIQANSGGGKSYAIRKLLEKTNGSVQHIVLDIEGDFSSLREKYDYVIAGKGGDVAVDPRSAEMLALRLLELQADTIIDLYELKQYDRIRFVKLFLDAMVNAPKTLWHPVLVVVDEAHIFCPEKGSAESMGSVIDLCTRGRKRGFCAVLATQRISKLHKDAAAECNNKMIGRTGLDIDVKRAADELGFPTNKNTTDLLRNLAPGEFYVFGPAISRDVQLGTIDKVGTTHAKAGQKGLGHKPPASNIIKQKLAKLADLPVAAEEETRDRNELRNRVKELERQLKTQKANAEVDPKAVEAIKKGFEKQLNDKIKDIAKGCLEATQKYLSTLIPSATFKTDSLVQSKTVIISKPIKKDYTPNYVNSGYSNLGVCEKKILGFLAVSPDRSFSKVQVGAMTGYAHSSGGFNNAISKLSQASYIVRNNGLLQLAPGADVDSHLVGVPHTLQDWIGKLGTCERKIYESLLKDPSTSLDKVYVAEETGYSAGSGGFNNAISRLNTLGLIKRVNGALQINDELVGL